MRARLHGSMLLVAAIFLSGAAGATQITVTYTGTVICRFSPNCSFAPDDAGLFGTPGADLSGAPFRLAFSFDTATATRDFVTENEEILFGGTGEGGAGSFGSYAMTINGHTATSGGEFFAADHAFNDLASGGTDSNSEQSVRGENRVDELNVIMQNQNGSGAFPSRVDIPFTHVLTARDSSFLYFQQFNSDQSAVTQFFGTPTTLTVSVSAVPLPPGIELLTSALALGGLLFWRGRGPRLGKAA